MVVNTNEPGTASSHTGSAITKPAVTENEVEDDALLHTLGEKHDHDVTDAKASIPSRAADYESKFSSNAIEETQFHAYDDHGSVIRPGKFSIQFK